MLKRGRNAAPYSLLNNFNYDSLIHLRRSCFHNYSDRLRDSALFADDLAHVLRRYSELQNDGLVRFDFLYADLFRMINKRFCDGFYSFYHSQSFSLLFRVSVGFFLNDGRRSLRCLIRNYAGLL